MDNNLIIEKIDKKKNKISIIFSAGNDWKKFLNGNEMWYSYDKDIEDVPDSIAIIPFMANVLPISWVFDLNISVEDIDSKFYKAYYSSPFLFTYKS